MAKKDIGKLEVLEGILKSESSGEAEASLDAIYLSVLKNAVGEETVGKDIVRYIIGFLLVTSAYSLLPLSSFQAILPPTFKVVERDPRRGHG